MSPRASVRRADHIEFGAWLIFDDAGGMRLTRTEPRLDRRERAMNLSITLPLSLWQTPTIRAVVTVADQGVASLQIDVDAAQAALKQVVGADVQITVETPPDGASSRPPADAGQSPGMNQND